MDAEAVDRLAHILFESYKEHVRRDGGAPTYERFEDQPEVLQESCRAQARGYWHMAALMGCEIAPLSNKNANRRVTELTDEQIETLARAEHERWVSERLANGWTEGTATNAELRQTPYLVPYDELDESVREYDREPIRKMPAHLKQAGYTLVQA